MENIRYIQVNKNALIELIQDDDNLMDFNYQITKDNKNNETSFSLLDDPYNHNIFSNVLNEVVLNLNKYQLYTINESSKNLGIIDDDKYTFFNTNQYTNNQPSQYDKVKIWFPINYTFSDVQGLHLNIYSLDYDNKNKYNLSNFYFDKNIESVILEDKPFRMNERLWGKSITLYIPNLEYEANKRTDNKSTISTINRNLAGSRGLSTTAPIYFDFRFLYSKKEVLGETTYRSTSKVLFSTPQSGNTKKLSVKIEHANDGDYFKINGMYNNSPAELADYMDMKKQSGDDSYILYTITLYEDNIPQTVRDIYVYQNYSKGIDDYRPVIKYTNTIASIRVDMQIVSNVTDTAILKTAEYVMTGNEVAKYGKVLSKINIDNALKPKIYNSAPVKLQLSNPKIIKTYNTKIKKEVETVEVTNEEVKYISYPVLYDKYNIAIKNISESNDREDIAMYGRLTINLNPFDNVFTFNILDYSNDKEFKGFEIPTSNTEITMRFSSDDKDVKIPLYKESNEINLKEGIVTFKISKSELSNIRKIKSQSDKWYITLKDHDTETVLYKGRFTMDDDNSDVKVDENGFKLKKLYHKMTLKDNTLKKKKRVMDKKEVIKTDINLKSSININKYNL